MSGGEAVVCTTSEDNFLRFKVHTCDNEEFGFITEYNNLGLEVKTLFKLPRDKMSMITSGCIATQITNYFAEKSKGFLFVQKNPVLNFKEEAFNEKVNLPDVSALLDKCLEYV
jgi:hypothetical protein